MALAYHEELKVSALDLYQQEQGALELPEELRHVLMNYPMADLRYEYRDYLRQIGDNESAKGSEPVPDIHRLFQTIQFPKFNGAWERALKLDFEENREETRPKREKQAKEDLRELGRTYQFYSFDPIGLTNGDWNKLLGHKNYLFLPLGMRGKSDELGKCCADLIQVRALLGKARLNGGLCRYDVIELKDTIECHEPLNRPTPILDKILNHFMIGWNSSPILPHLNKERRQFEHENSKHPIVRFVAGIVHGFSTIRKYEFVPLKARFSNVEWLKAIGNRRAQHPEIGDIGDSELGAGGAILSEMRDLLLIAQTNNKLEKSDYKKLKSLMSSYGWEDGYLPETENLSRIFKALGIKFK